MKESIVLIGVIIASLWHIVLSIKDANFIPISIEDFNFNPTFPFRIGPYNYTIRIDERLSTPGDIVEGSRVTLTCEIHPPNALTFWRHDFHHNTHKVLRTYPKHGIYAFDKYLTFEKIDKSYEGKYDCVGYPQQHPIAIISTNITLKVNEKPKDPSKAPDIRENVNVTLRFITITWTPQSVAQNSDVSMECDFSPPTNSKIIPRNYTFFKDNKEVFATAEDANWYKGSVLTLRQVEPTDAGMYLCKVGTDKGYFMSNFLPINVVEAKLSDEVQAWWEEVDKYVMAKHEADLIAAVKAHAKLGYEYYADDIREYDTVHFVCTIDSNLTQIRKITWFQNGRILETNDDIGITQQDQFLFLHEIPKEMAGDYNCIVETTHNTTINSTTTLLRIKYDYNESTRALECPCPNNTACPCNGHKVQPEVLMQLKPGINPEIIIEGDTVSFTCTLLPLRVTRIRRIFWYHNGQKLSRTDKVGMLYGNTTLVLPRIQKHYSGTYQCMIDTDLDVYYSKETIVITVYDPSLKVLPTVTAKLGKRWHSNSVKEYDDVYFQCEIEPGFENVRKIEWLRNGKILNPLEWRISTIYWNTILVVPKIEITGAGKYECLVTTKTAVTIRSNPVEIIVEIIPKNVPIPEKNLLVIPTIEWHPEEIYVNKSMYFKCHYYLSPNPETVYRIIWYYNGNMLMLPAELENTWYQYIYNDDLLIPVLKKEYVGEFNCIVVTTRGNFLSEFPAKVEKIMEERSEVASLNNAVKTTLIAELQNDPDHVYEDDPVSFWCNVQPNTTDIVTINWYLNETRVYTLHPEPDGYFIPFGERTHVLPYANIKQHTGDHFCEIITFEGLLFKSPPTKLIIKERELCFFVKNNITYDNCPKTGFVEVSVQLGDPSQINFIHENDDIYFTCIVNPHNLTVFERIFYVDGKRIYPDRGGGIIYQDGELYIYNIAKDAIGTYSCEVHTKKGRYISVNEVDLDVKPPRF